MHPDICRMFDLTGRVALVTGGAGLLGRQFSRTLAAAGARDITDPHQVEEAVATLRSRWGRLDVLVNSAALDPKVSAEGQVQAAGAFEDFPLDLWRQALEVNLTGTFLITQAAARLMREQGKGSIINICSTYGLVGPDQRIYQKPGRPPQYKPVYYSVTKAAMLGFTRYLAAYYAGTQIRVNALTPGGVYNQQDPDFVEKYSARTILGRMAREDELNAALLFLASDASSYMTGANLVVDGGWTAW